MQKELSCPGRSAARSHKRVYARLRRAMAKLCAADPGPLRAVAVSDQRGTPTRCLALHRIPGTSDRAARGHHPPRPDTSLAARDRGPAQQFVDGKGRSQDLDLLVGVPRPDLRNRKTPQTNDAASVDGHQSSEMAPVPTGILGRLWRVPVLGPCLQGIDVV